MSRRSRIITALAGTAAAVALAAPPASATHEVQTPPFDVAGMAQKVEERLGGVTGWAYGIAKDGKLAAAGAGGKARTGVDGDVDMTTGSRMEIWSATKTYTAVATLKLLEQHPAHLDSAVSAYLPDGWVRGPGFGPEGVTFRQLLDHTSGLGQVGDALTPAEREAGVWSTTWDGNRYAVAKGTNPGQAWNYTNMNYALLRVLNARLWRDVEPDAVPVQNAGNTGLINLGYVNAKLLQPAGVGPAYCFSFGDAFSTLHYNADAPDLEGVEVELAGTPERQACAGHRGLHLSATQMVRFMAHLTHGSIVSAGVRKQMDDFKLGWNRSSNDADRPGIFWHGGAGFLGGGREGHTCHMKYPNGMQAALIVNSSLKGVGAGPCGVLLQSWQEAR